MTYYDRAVAGLFRRELLKLVSMLGAAAVARPLVARPLFGKPIFDGYPFSLGVASELDPIPWTSSERRIRWPEWDQTSWGAEPGGSSVTSSERVRFG